jgi:hypothetical protein
MKGRPSVHFSSLSVAFAGCGEISEITVSALLVQLDMYKNKICRVLDHMKRISVQEYGFSSYRNSAFPEKASPQTPKRVI